MTPVRPRPEGYRPKLGPGKKFLPAHTGPGEKQTPHASGLCVFPCLGAGYDRCQADLPGPHRKRNPPTPGSKPGVDAGRASTPDPATSRTK